MDRKKRWVRAMAGGLLLCAALSLCGAYSSLQGIRQSVVRLHILANSDSEEDQQLKLRVRDAVVTAAAGWLDGAADADEALRMAEERLPQLEAVAQQTVQEAGYAYPVQATLCRMYFTTRKYDTVTLPAGMYDAVRFTIGAGQGRNWWCVVFPPMCVGAATEEKTLTDVLDSRQEELVTGGERYVVRFKLVEWVESLLHALCPSRAQ